jgi:hypothetical protein
MTLEISEIGIRLAVGDPAPVRGGGHESRFAGAAVAPAVLTPQQVEELVQTCVREVLRTLRMAEER